MMCSVPDCGRAAIARGWCSAHYRRWMKFGDLNHGGPLPPSAHGICSVDGCAAPANTSGLCPPHKARLERHGDPMGGRRSRGSAVPECSVEGCSREAKARGWCTGHYKRWQKYGDPLGRSTNRIVGDDVARFWSKVDKSPDCWLWLGERNELGYGSILIGGVGGKRVKAHRYAYELLVGPIPEGLELDHLCRNPSCVNPDHLEPVTHAENVRRGRAGETTRARFLAQTHCKHGHEFTPENTRQTPKQRVCRKCCARRQQERIARLREVTI